MPDSALPGESVLLGTVGRNGIPADGVAAAGSAKGVAIELTGDGVGTEDGVGTTAATVRLGDSLQRVMPTIAMMHRVTKAQGSTLCGVGLAAFLRLLAFRIKILRATTADRLRTRGLPVDRCFRGTGYAGSCYWVTAALDVDSSTDRTRACVFAIADFTSNPARVGTQTHMD
jgi:hypothetical protein